MTTYDESVIQQEVAVIGTLARGLNDFLQSNAMPVFGPYKRD